MLAAMVDATHNIAVAMCQGTLDRIGIPKARLVQECRCCRTESVRGDFFFRVSHATECGIERVFTHGTLGAARRWENISFAAEHLGQISEIASNQIGRASCREGVCQYVDISVVAVTLKK